MTWQEALDAAVNRTGVARYRDLCDEANPDTLQRDAYRRLMLKLAGQPAPEPPPSPPVVPLAASIRGIRLGLRSCLYSTHEGCGCAGAHCHHLARVVTLNDCLDCLPPPKREI